MPTPRPRSTFWVVSTHVLTTGFAIPIVAVILAFGILYAISNHLPPHPEELDIVIVMAIQAMGYVAGTYYSLSYLRRVALIERPERCILPSIISFCVLIAIAMMLNGAAMHAPAPLIAVLVVYCAAICLAFAFITRNGFRRMAGANEPRGFDVLPPHQPQD